MIPFITRFFTKILPSVCFFFTACGPEEPTPTSASTDTVALIRDNAELAEIYAQDQSDRQGEIDWDKVSDRDSTRKMRVYEILDAGLVKTGNDYHHAAMIFQHGGDSIASGMAVKLMKKAIEIDSSQSKWLLAAAIDRDLMYRKKPQIYGTQYVKKEINQPWVIYDLDTTQISDEERREYGVSTLAEQRIKAMMMNKKELVSLLQDEKNIEKVLDICKNEKPEESEYNLSERGINDLGYLLMEQNKMDEALLIFQCNTERYPEGFNTFDSYGECLWKMGYYQASLLAYQKSLELNPKSESAITMIEKLNREIEQK